MQEVSAELVELLEWHAGERMTEEALAGRCRDCRRPVSVHACTPIADPDCLGPIEGWFCDACFAASHQEGTADA